MGQVHSFKANILSIKKAKFAFAISSKFDLINTKKDKILLALLWSHVKIVRERYFLKEFLLNHSISSSKLVKNSVVLTVQ
jgi:hypothetical protein